MSPHKLPTHFRANDVICSLLLRATQTCRRTCGQCESTIRGRHCYAAWATHYRSRLCHAFL